MNDVWLGNLMVAAAAVFALLVVVLLHHIFKEIRKMSTALDSLAAQVAANTSVEESAVALIKGLADELAAAGTDPAALAALQTKLNASASDLAAAITANTPSAPPVSGVAATPATP